MNRRPALRLAALVIAAAPFLASCSSMLDDQTIGTMAPPAGGPLFNTYAAIGTSIGAGIQSGGINDSTQREAFTYQLAVQMGLTPGVNWFYPSMNAPGCPAPLINALTGARVGGASATACAARATSSIHEFINNVSIPSLRAAQAIHITNLDFPATDTLKLAQFITGSRNPLDMVVAEHPTFVTLEVGFSDMLGAATRGDPLLLTSVASFSASIDTILARLDSTGAKIAISNVPNVASIPHFSKASVMWCLKNGVCGFPAAAPFNLASFSIDNSCAPVAVNPAAIGDTYLLTFATIGSIVGTLSAGRFASLNCGTDQALVAPAATPTVPSVPAGATITPAELAAINARVLAFNAKIATAAALPNHTLVDFAALLAAQAANIPAFPSLSTPLQLFGTLFSQDGIHPTKAGHRIIANGFIAAINAAFSASLTPIP